VWHNRSCRRAAQVRRELRQGDGTYYNALELLVPVSGNAPFDLTVGYQGCADAGLCCCRWL
jgi:thiol:disulfide interchange protein